MAKNEYIRTIPNDYSQYSTLVDREIRLLQIHQTSSTEDRDGPLTCELFRVESAGASPYSALSYCWGDLTDTRPITLVFRDATLLRHDLAAGSATMAGLDRIPSKTTQNFMVTTNLFHALKAFRRDRFKGFLWADMLCINQADMAERSQQVSMMKSIYECASAVEVWLGGNPGQPSHVLLPEDDLMTDSLITNVDTETALTEAAAWAEDETNRSEMAELTPERFVSCLGKDELTNFVWVSLIRSGVLPRGDGRAVAQRREQIFDTLVGPASEYFDIILFILRYIFGTETEEDGRSKKSVTKFFDRATQLDRMEWFCRVWVIQEVVYSRQTFVRHAGARIKWHSMLNVLRLMHNLLAARWSRKMLWGAGDGEGAPLLWTQGLTPPLWPHWKPDPGYALVPSLTPLDIIYQTSSFLATDPRDRLFGILSLIPSTQGPSPFRPDYTRSMPEVACSFTRWYYESLGSWDVLSLCHPRGQKAFFRNHALPSWAIDFGKDYGSIHPFALQKGPNGLMRFSTGLEKHPPRRRGVRRIRKEIHFQQDDKLTLLGCVAARVVKVWSMGFNSIPWFPDPSQWESEEVLDGPLFLQPPESAGEGGAEPETVGFQQLAQAISALRPMRPRSGDARDADPVRWKKAMAAHVDRIVEEMWGVFYEYAGLGSYRERGGTRTVEDVEQLKQAEANFRSLLAAIALVSRLEIEDVAKLINDSASRLGHTLFPLFCRVTASKLAAKAVSTDALDSFVYHSINWTMFVTHDGRIGVGHVNMREGDSVVVIHGASTPYIVRPARRQVGSKDPRSILREPVEWKLVGECYIEGYMQGELVGDPLYDDRLSAEAADLFGETVTTDLGDAQTRCERKYRSSFLKQAIVLV